MTISLPVCRKPYYTYPSSFIEKRGKFLHPISILITTADIIWWYFGNLLLSSGQFLSIYIQINVFQ